MAFFKRQEIRKMPVMLFSEVMLNNLKSSSQEVPDDSNTELSTSHLLCGKEES